MTLFSSTASSTSAARMNKKGNQENNLPATKGSMSEWNKGNCRVKSYLWVCWSHIMMGAVEEVPWDFIMLTSRTETTAASLAYFFPPSLRVLHEAVCTVQWKKTKQHQTPAWDIFWQQPQTSVVQHWKNFGSTSPWNFFLPWPFWKYLCRKAAKIKYQKRVRFFFSCFILLTTDLPIMGCPSIQARWHTTLQLRQLHDSKLQLVAAISLSAHISLMWRK